MLECNSIEYDRIDISGGIDINKTNASKERDIGFKYEPSICSDFHGLMQKAMSCNDVAIIYVKGSVSKIHFWYVSKDNAISIMNNSSLIDR